VPTATLADMINRASEIQTGRTDSLGDADLTLTCDRCGRPVRADSATVTVSGDRCVYACPHDGDDLAAAGPDAVEIYGEITIRVDGTAFTWASYFDIDE
jgi:hypothetical protein